MCRHDVTLHICLVEANSYQLLLSESPQLSYLILKHEIRCIKGSKNICFLIFYILSETINQSIIWVASSSFMESSTYSPPDPHFKPFPFFLRTQSHFSESSEFFEENPFLYQGGRSWQPFGEGKKALKYLLFSRQMRRPCA